MKNECEIIEPPQSRNRYTTHFRIDAVRRLLESGQSASAISEILGVELSVLYRWKRRYSEQVLRPLPVETDTVVSRNELVMLKREVDELRDSVQVLKGVLSKTLLDRCEFEKCAG